MVNRLIRECEWKKQRDSVITESFGGRGKIDAFPVVEPEAGDRSKKKGFVDTKKGHVGSGGHEI